MFVAEFEGKQVGTISIGESRHYRMDSLRFLALDVGAADRRKGVGAALIVVAESEATRLGFKSVHCEVGTENSDAIRLYESLGYERRERPVVNQWWQFQDDGSRIMAEEPSWVMVKSL